MPQPRRGTIVFGIVALAVLLVCIWLLKGELSSDAAQTREPIVASTDGTNLAAGPQSPTGAVARSQKARLSEEQRKKLAAMLQAAREKRISDAHSLAKAKLPAANDATASPLALKNRTGSNEPWELRQLEVLNRLLGECESLARAENQNVTGTVALNFTIYGEPGIGGLVEDVSFDERGTTLREPTLLECFKESIYALELDPPPEGVRESRMITLRLGPE